MRRIDKAGIERRLAICEALQAEPYLRYRELQARFGVNPATVRSAIKGGIDAWRQALGKAPAEATPPPSPSVAAPARWEHACATIRSVAGDEGTVTYEATDEGDGEAGLAGLPSLAAVLDAYGKLGWELAALVKVGKGDGGGLTGTWEATFKRPVPAKK